MSFFKKLLGQEYVSPEEKEKALIIKEEKRQQREVEYAQQQKKKKQAADMQLMEKYFGKSAGFFNRVGFSLYKSTIIHFEKYIKSSDEEVLIAIPAEYDKTKKREIKGMLIATSHRLIFVTNGIGHGEFTEAFDYRKMNGISLAPDGFAQKELLIDYGRTRKIFDDIANDDQFKQFLKVVRSKMNESKRVTGISKAKNKAAAHSDDKYEKLAQIAKLRDQGVLTEEEFEIEKQKILNS